MSNRTLLVQPLSQVQTRRQQWAYKQLIPLRVLTIVAGIGGIGKSTILAWIVAGLTKGDFEGDFAGQPVSVGFIAAEDDSETTLVPRLKAADANLEQVHNFSTVLTIDADGNQWKGLPRIGTDLQALKNALIEFGIRVLIIDPVLSIMEGDSIKAGDVRKNLDPIASLANELDIAIVLVMHFNKGHGNASEKLSGSHAFRDTARSVLLLAVDEETNHRILSVDKSNYSPESPSFAFDIETVDILTDDGELSSIGRANLLGASSVSVHELVRRADVEGLGDLSSEIVELVNSSAGELTAKDISEELDISLEKARTYAGRLVKSARIKRTGRGRYAGNGTGSPTVQSVQSVSNVSKTAQNDTHDTHITLFRNVTLCVVCGTDLHPSLTDSGINTHPLCEED